MPRQPDLAAVASYVDAAAVQLGLRIDPAWRDSVIGYLTAYFAVASWLEELPLAEQVEPAPVFEP